jgi:hypothetical protein
VLGADEAQTFIQIWLAMMLVDGIAFIFLAGHNRILFKIVVFCIIFLGSRLYDFFFLEIAA